jgi:hypothetical protein
MSPTQVLEMLNADKASNDLVDLESTEFWEGPVCTELERKAPLLREPWVASGGFLSSPTTPQPIQTQRATSLHSHPRPETSCVRVLWCPAAQAR